MKRFILLLFMLEAEARSCGQISNAEGKKITIPCSVNRHFSPKNEALPSSQRVVQVTIPQELSASFRARQQQWKALINRIAQEYEMERALIHAVISVESAYQVEAQSPKGALGLMQLMPNTALYLGVNPHQVEDNLRGGVRYLKEQLQAFKRLDWALAAYNAGPQNVLRYRGIPPFAETQQYVQLVMQYQQRYLNEWKSNIQ